MKTKLSQLKKQLGFHKKIAFFLIGLAIVGIIMGSFFTVILKGEDKSLVKEYMQNFMAAVEKGKSNIVSNFLNIGLENIFLILVIWTLGISIIGVPIILFLYFSKAFVIGFSVSSFLITYKAKGILYALFYLFPHQLINFILYILLLNYAIILSSSLAKSFFHKKTFDFKVVMKKYSFILLFVFCGLLITAIYESVFLPKVLKIGISLFS